MVGVVLAGAKEMKNTSLKNLKDVRAYTNLPVLSSIPLLENALLVRRKRRLLWLAWSSAMIIGSIAMSGSACTTTCLAAQRSAQVDGSQHGRNDESSTRCITTRGDGRHAAAG